MTEAIAAPRSPYRLIAARRWLRVLLVLLAPLVLAGNLGALDRRLDLLSNLQVQFMWAALVLTVGLACVRSWRFAAIAGLCLIACAWQVLPWYWPGRGAGGVGGVGGVGGAMAAAAMNPPRSLRVMLHNVWQPNDKYAEVMAQVRAVQPDVVVFQEVDERWFAELAPLADAYPFSHHAPGARLRGMAIFSRLPLRNVREIALTNPLSPSIDCIVDVDGAAVSVVCTHPWPPIGEEMTASRDEQLREAGVHMATRPRPAMLIGDLNTGMWSPHYRAMETSSGLHNVREGFGVIATHPMNEPLYPRVPIDHILVSDDLIVRDVRRGDACGSDHAALIADLIVE